MTKCPDCRSPVTVFRLSEYRFTEKIYLHGLEKYICNSVFCGEECITIPAIEFLRLKLKDMGADLEAENYDSKSHDDLHLYFKDGEWKVWT